MKYTLIAFFFSLFIALTAKSNMVTPEVYGVKFNEIYLCQSASCDNAIKIGGGDRIDIADPFFNNSVGSLVDLKNANLGTDTYSHLKFNVDMRILVKANSGSCWSTPSKIEPGYSAGTNDQSAYGEQIIQMHTDYVNGDGITNVTTESFDYIMALGGTYQKGQGQSIQWNIDVTNSINFEECEIGPEEPNLNFSVVQF